MSSILKSNLNNKIISLILAAAGLGTRFSSEIPKQYFKIANQTILEKTLNILNNKEIGDLKWIEYRDLKEGASAFKEIHEGKCTAPKIILLI